MTKRSPIWWHLDGGNDGEPFKVIDKRSDELVREDPSMVFTAEQLHDLLRMAPRPSSSWRKPRGNA